MKRQEDEVRQGLIPGGDATDEMHLISAQTTKSRKSEYALYSSARKIRVLILGTIGIVMVIVSVFRCVSKRVPA